MAVQVAPVDTTGCGDAFAAGFLFGWCGGRDVRRGSASASTPRPPAYTLP